MRATPFLLSRLAKQVILVILSLLPFEVAYSTTKLEIVGGVIDLRAWDTERDPLMEIKGEARFSWQAFNVSAPKSEKASDLIEFPGSWHKIASYPLYGYATYEFDILSEASLPITIDLGSIGSSYRIYLDGRLVLSSGNPQPSEVNFERASANKAMFTFILPKGRMHMSIEVANYDYIVGGISKTVQIGTPDAVIGHRFRTMISAFILFGAYLAIGLYHFGLFSLRRRDRSSLYFGLFCLATTPCILINMQINTLDLLGPHPMPLAVYLASSLGLAIPCLGLFMAYLYNSRATRIATFYFGALFVALSLVLIFSFKMYLAFMGFLFVIGLPVTGVFIATIIKAVRSKQQGAFLMLTSFCIMIGTAVNDFANFNNLINSVPLFSIGTLAFLLMQSYLLSARFSKAFSQVETSEKEIRQLSLEIKIQHDHVLAVNENLEQLAEEKTRDIRSILAHIQLGICAITPQDQAIHKDHSQHLCEIFEVDDFSDMPATQLLLERSNLTSDEISQARSVLEASLGEDVLVFEMNSQGLPHEICLSAPSGREKLLELHWHPIITEQNVTEKILVTVKDVTDFRALAEDAQDKKEELQFISELLNVSAESFRKFIQNAYDFIKENKKLINSQSIHHKDMEVLKILFINMHTMKGAARSLYFKKMTKVFHDVEQYYARLQSDTEAHWDVEKMNRDLSAAESIIATYEGINRSKLGRKTSGERDIEIPEARLTKLYGFFLDASRSAFSQNGLAEFFRDLRAFFTSSLFRPVHDVLEEIYKCSGTLAKDLEKEKPTIEISARGLELSHEGEDLFRKIFVHLLRNSLDHGIEKADERIGKNKAPSGTISMVFNQEGRSVFLRYQDDGRGLDIARICKIALDKRLVSDPSKLSLEEAAELIFYSGLSTANQVSDVSGRGIGMDAVRSYLKKHGGSIQVRFLNSQPDDFGCYPFSFEIVFPDHLFATELKLESPVAA